MVGDVEVAAVADSRGPSAKEVGASATGIGLFGAVFFKIGEIYKPELGQWGFVVDYLVPAASALVYSGLRWLGSAFKLPSGERFNGQRRLKRARTAARKELKNASSDAEREMLECKILSLTERLIDGQL